MKYPFFQFSESIIEGLQSAVLVLDERSHIKYLNTAAESFFGHSRRVLLGKPIRELISDQTFQACISRVISNQSQFALREMSVETLSASIKVDISLSPIDLENDISKGILVEIHSVNSRSQFIKQENQIERIKSFRLMMRGLAHEIKNPLGGLRGAAQLLSREVSDPSHRELIEILVKESDRLTRMVDRIMGPREQIKRTSTNAHELLEHVAKVLEARDIENLLIHREYDPALPELEVDSEQLIQALLNLSVNAIEAQQDSESDVVIGFKTEFVRLVTISQRLYKQAAKITVWDEGPGIPKHIKNNVFDPLITGRPEGTGLGLSITQEIIQRHHGSVVVEELNGKTAFAIYLPYLSFESESDLKGKHENYSQEP